MKSNCKCKGASVLLEMAELYEKLGTNRGHMGYLNRPLGSNLLEREKAKLIVEKILKIISPKDVYSPENGKLWKSHLRDAKVLLHQCKDGIGVDCIYALEYIRAVIHGDWGVRAKILCDLETEPPFSKDNEEVLKAMYALRGAFYGKPKDAVRMLKNLKDKYC